jgi:hypothetical protein
MPGVPLESQCDSAHQKLHGRYKSPCSFDPVFGECAALLEEIAGAGQGEGVERCGNRVPEVRDRPGAGLRLNAGACR